MEEKYINQAAITPHWINGGEGFWYQHYLSPGEFEFILVNAATKQRQPAFDHQRLAEALKQHVEQPVGPYSLPFSWINLDIHASSVRFTCNEKKWIFNSDNLNTIKEWDGSFDRPTRLLLTKEMPSGESSHHVTVNFINHTNETVSRYWIDWDGNAKSYGSIGQGQASRQRTYAGHVWKLVGHMTKAVKAIYVAPHEDEHTIVIDEGTMEEAKTFQSEVPARDRVDEHEEGKGHSEVGEPSVFVKDFNVWVKSSDGTETAMSFNGAEENPYDSSRVYLSPDDRFAVVWQYVPEQEHTLHLRESAPADQLEPRVRSMQYLKPGDRVKVDRPRLFSLGSKSEVDTDDALFRDPYQMIHIGWNPAATEYRFLFNERGHQHLRVVGVDISGRVSALIEERSETFIDYSQKLYHRLIADTDELIWASERDGTNHLYLFNLGNGQLKSQITKGEWNVHSVVSIDDETRQIWLKGYGMVPEQDVYHAHLASVKFDGTEFKVLTDGDGTHQRSLSPDKSYFIDAWSRVDAPPKSVLRNLHTGEKLLHLEGKDEDVEELLSGGWVAPERFVAAGRDDETQIYGIIIRPSNFNPLEKYPILEDIYAGPQGFHTPKCFSALEKQRRWADLGCVVVILDGMGTNWRSKRFHNVCYKNLQDAGFPDRIAWIRSAAETRPWMDVSRVGVSGGSAGGQNAVAALLFHNTFYRVAIADSGCHDNRMDKLWWNEQWMGYPVDKAYEASSNVVHANKLQGALMLIVGDVDDNVDPVCTFQLVKTLNEAGKDFEFLFIPGGDHCCGRYKFALRRQERFLRRHLLGNLSVK